MKKPKTNLEILQSIRRDWGEVNPAMKVFEDKRDKRARKYPKQLIEEEENLSDSYIMPEEK